MWNCIKKHQTKIKKGFLVLMLMKEKIGILKKSFSNNKTIVKNIGWLSVLQLANYGIPLLIIPIVTRALGVDSFGKASYAQNIILYLTLIINYGFDFTANQGIAINRNDREKIVEIFWSVINFKIILFIFSYLILGILYFFFDQVHNDPISFFYASIINLGMILFPIWFFQGMEEIKKMAVFNFLIRLIGAILIIIFINSPKDYKLYNLILSISYLAVGIFAFSYTIRKYKLHSINLYTLKFEIIKKGLPVFINNCFISLYYTFGVTYIGIQLTSNEVGLYSGCMKIMMAILMLTTMPLSTAIFPKMSRLFHENKGLAWTFFRKILVISSIIGVILGMIIFITAPQIIQLFLGEPFLETTPYIRTMSVLPLLVMLATILTVQGLYGMQLQRFAPLVGGISGCTGLLLSLFLIPKHGIYGAIFAWIGAQIIEIITDSIILTIQKRRL